MFKEVISISNKSKSEICLGAEGGNPTSGGESGILAHLVDKTKCDC